MKKFIFTFCLLAILLGAFIWYRSQQYLIAFFEPLEYENLQNEHLYLGFKETWKLGIKDAKVSDKNTLFISIPSDIQKSNEILEEKINKFLLDHPKWWWNDKKILIVAGFISNHLKIASDLVHKHKRNILSISPISTTPKAVSWLNVLQAIHNDKFGANAITMYAARKQYDKAVILYHKDDSYSEGYQTELTESLTKQQIEHISILLNNDSIEDLTNTKINPYLTSSKKPLVILLGYKDELIKIEKSLDPKIELIGTDICANIKDIFNENRVVTIVIPSIIDYTTTTNYVYKNVLEDLEQKILNFNYIISYAVPFLYDCAFQVGNIIANNKNFTWNNFQNRYKPALPAAALVSTWYDHEQKGPAHGGYWFIYTHDTEIKNFPSYNKKILGNVYTLKESAAVAYQIGKFAWAGLLGWNVYQNIWEKYFINGQKLGVKSSYINYEFPNGISNWNPIHVKSYRSYEGKWFFASDVEDKYPIEEKEYQLK
jgi:hypothetical protein